MQRFLYTPPMAPKIPVTVLTGFLGSGKTTLLNRILSEDHGMRIAVIENEFGEIGIDQDLVINADEEIFELNNGCICCNVRGDLIRILGEMSGRLEQFDRVILETTGLADPGPVAQTFLVQEDIQDFYQLDGIITLIDAKHVAQHLEDETDEVIAQIAFADQIIINKTDLVDSKEIRSVRKRLQTINTMSGIYEATMADAPIAELLDIGGFSVERAMDIKPEVMESEYHFHGAHSHSSTVSSVSVELPGKFDGLKLNAWLEEFLQENGPDIYRMKGVVGIDGQDYRFVFQGVHMIFGSEAAGEWMEETPVNRLVFIGKNLDEVFIRRSLEACLAA